ncbi:hypothetical protein ZIOFF_072478 [Zingiber officinale]|uniref:Uncharacterized protein n=1 Tax=Zingiber officinale TaxID=94328 RepID=A0A8J5BUW4_ZINOF|nr:hypothetical protein ZIOFF_072478 [Zingiber officinale]
MLSHNSQHFAGGRHSGQEDAGGLHSSQQAVGGRHSGHEAAAGRHSDLLAAGGRHSDLLDADGRHSGLLAASSRHRGQQAASGRQRPTPAGTKAIRALATTEKGKEKRGRALTSEIEEEEVVARAWKERKELGNAVGVDNTFRRKWDREVFLQKARERERQEEEEDRFKSKDKAAPPVQRKPLKHRDYEVDLDSRLGITQVVTPIAPLSKQAGYYSAVCECVVKDSANSRTIIMEKKHQKALGMSMRVERATLQQVQERFESLKKLKVPESFTEQDLRRERKKKKKQRMPILIWLL